MLDTMTEKGDVKKQVIDVGARIRSVPLVLTPEMSYDLIGAASFVSMALRCPCRDERSCEDFPADFGCLYMGEGARGIVAKGNAREITKPEAVDHIKGGAAMGLVQMVLWTSAELRALGGDAGRALELCSCCPCCCLNRRTGDGMRAYVDGIAGMAIARAEGDCSACGECVLACAFKAITVTDEGPEINADRCKGCGRCAIACRQGVLKVYPLEAVPSFSGGWEMIPAATYREEIAKIVR